MNTKKSNKTFVNKKNPFPICIYTQAKLMALLIEKILKLKRVEFAFLASHLSSMFTDANKKHTHKRMP